MLPQAFYTSLLIPLVAGFAFGDPTFTKVHQFNCGEFIENLAVRSNGKILVKDPLFLGNAQQPLGINGIKV